MVVRCCGSVGGWRCCRFALIVLVCCFTCVKLVYFWVCFGIGLVICVLGCWLICGVAAWVRCIRSLGVWGLVVWGWVLLCLCV